MHKSTHAAVGFLIAMAGTTACGSRSSSAGVAAGGGGPTIRSLGLPTAANSTPVLAASGNWVVAVWTASEHERTDIYAATSKDGAVQFGAPVRVNDVEGEAHVYGEDPPRVAIGPSAAQSQAVLPEIVVTWPSDRTKHLGLRSARSLDGGRTFLPSTSVGDEAIAGERGFQSVTVGPDRVVHAAWLDGRRDPGTPHHANAGNDYDPMHLMFASGAVNGRWKVENRLATNVCGCCKTAIATAADGSIFVAFRNIYPGSLRDISFTVSHDGGQTFAPPARVSEDHWMLEGCPDDGPTMALDRDGAVHLVWPTLVQGEQPAIGLFHASTRDGVTFTARQRIETLGTPRPSHPQLVADACGSLTLVWNETQGSTRRAMMRQLTPLPPGDVRVGELHVVSGPHSAAYPVVAPTLTGVVAAWTDIDRSNADRSDIALRRIPLNAGCEVPADAATPLSIANNVTAAAVPVKRYTANVGSASAFAPLLNPTTGFGCAHNVRSMTAKRSRKRVASVREYIASKPKESRDSLEAVRRAILKALPNAQEGLAYQMPAYTLNGVGVLYFAGWKSHYSLYPASDALVEAFAKQLLPYERSKGTLKFPLSEPVPVRLIERIAKFRARQLTTRDAATGRRKGGREGQVDRIRRLCAALPSAFEKMSHGTPCFFVEQGKGCFAMFSEHHRDDGRLSLWVPVADGLQTLMIEESPDIYFYPRYVGAGGWVGILLDQIADDALESHLREARRIIASKRKPARKPRGM